MVKVAATATLGTTVHTAHASAQDEIHLWAVNSDTTARKLTIEFGGAAAPDNLIEITIPPEAGLIPILPGLVLTNSLVVTAFAETANVVMVAGFINRIT
jgi:hypothetical protein